MVVWTKEELEKEQIRGVFAIGVLATLFGYQTIKNQFPASDIAAALINIITLFLGVFWGIYIACSAFSMLNWSPNKREEWVLNLAKHIGVRMFWYGSVFSVLFAILLAPFMIYESILQYPTYFVPIYIAGLVGIVLIVIIAVYDHFKRKKAR